MSIYVCRWVGGKNIGWFICISISCLICINRMVQKCRRCFVFACSTVVEPGWNLVPQGRQQNMVLTSLSDSWTSQVFSSISLRWEGGASRTFRNRSWAWRPQCWQVPCSTSSIRERIYVWLVRIWKSSWHLQRGKKNLNLIRVPPLYFQVYFRKCITLIVVSLKREQQSLKTSIEQWNIVPHLSPVPWKPLDEIKFLPYE